MPAAPISIELGTSPMSILLSGQLFISALAAGAIYALVAVGLNLVYGTLRLLNVSHGDLVMLGAYAAYWVVALSGFGPLWSIPIVLIFGILLGAVSYFGLFRYMLRQSHTADRIESNSLLAFFAVSIILQNSIALIFTNNTRAYQYLEEIIQLGNISITANRLLALVVSLLSVIAVAVFLRRSIYGLAIRAVIQNRDAAAIVGINLRILYLTSLVVGFSLAMIAGVLVSMHGQIWPFMGFSFTVSAFVVIMLGGLGNIMGGLAAALLLGVLETYGLAIVGASYRSILVYCVFVGVLMLKPEGLFGRSRVTQ
jgi:branched-chain amino acid transport system permease protein